MTPERRAELGKWLIQAAAVVVTAVLLAGCALLFTGVSRLGRAASPGLLPGLRVAGASPAEAQVVPPPRSPTTTQPVEPAPVPTAPRRQPPPVADAGDDQLGLVGRPVVLDGIRSQPQGEVGYRWIQVAGPAAPQQIEQGATLSFVPREVGVYRFALVVASGEQVSRPDVVEVQVGTWTAPAAAPPEVQATSFSPPSLPTLTQFAGTTLASMTGGPERGDDLARTFEEVAERVGLYPSYGDLFVELSRRLDGVVPQDPSSRKAWQEQLFAPLTAPLLAALRREGLDLLTPAGQAAPLTEPQRRVIADQFREMARGFRETTARR